MIKNINKLFYTLLVLICTGSYSSISSAEGGAAFNSGGPSVTLIITYAIILISLFFLPSILAFKKKHPQKVPILLVNIFAGAIFGIGWVIALIWVFIKPNNDQAQSSTPVDASNEIEKLHELKEKGILTQDEFDLKKKALLST